ncbi:Pycsar system effector family protein [Streptomyces sp. H51]|uniref:Pycsar system effector family protein n=1 Tax=Streptomyces sp. H51 TaxID=3111770 RepID=UPI002D76B117|nr:Pycsar system effector family protein [Streptomyces sp. H51]
MTTPQGDTGTAPAPPPDLAPAPPPTPGPDARTAAGAGAAGEGAAGGGAPDGGAALARVLLSEAREELAKADNKAGLLLASLGAALTALLGAIGSGVIAPRQYAVVPQLLLWVGCAACAPALVLLGLAVTPRLGDPRSSRTHCFGDARTAMSAAQLERTVRRTDPVSRDLRQLAALSRTAWTKYRCIRQALVWGTAFFALTLLGIVMGAVT